MLSGSFVVVEVHITVLQIFTGSVHLLATLFPFGHKVAQKVG